VIKNKRLFILLLFVLTVGLFLSVFRYPDSDESFYMRETSLLSHSLVNFQWFGNEPVGLHGFIFKLPAALLFLITGPSVFVATLTNIILGVLVIFLVYSLLSNILGSHEWAFFGAFLVATNVCFLNVLPTFLRECPAILSVLLLLYAVINKKKYGLIGIAFLLLLDAKEGIFFVTLVGFLIWLFYVEIFAKGKNQVALNGWRFSKRVIIILIPVSLYISLMLFTGLVPLNKKLTSYIGLNQGGIRAFVEYQIRNVENQYRFEIIKKESSVDIEKSQIQMTESKQNIFKKLLYIFQLYIRKILYFRTFSLSSMPRFMIVIAMAVSVLCFKEWRRNNEYNKLLLVFMFWTFLSVHILRTSHGRYLLPVVPIVILFFIYFLKDFLKRKKFTFVTLLAACLFVSFGMLFETQYVFVKIMINAVIIAGLAVMVRLQQKESPLLPNFRIALISLIGMISIVISLSVSSLLPGQIGLSWKWGYCGEFKKIAERCGRGEKVWSNVDGELFRFFMRDFNITFQEKREIFSLKEWIPKANKINRDHEKIVYSFDLDSPTQFLAKLKENKINKVALVISNSDTENFRFPKQDERDVFEEMLSLHLQDRVLFKNKILYIYELTE